MPNQHIKEYLDYYIKSKNPEHAVMINGAWGSGKTWFIKDYVDNYEQPEDEIKFVHVSLYGLKTTEDIDNEIFRQAFPVLSSKPMVIGKAVAKGFIRGFLKIDLDGDGKDDSQIKLNEMEGAFSTKDLSSDNLILIFDDMERTSIDTIELLGYVNHFVEIQGYKAILISNEGALNKRWQKDGEVKYEKALHTYSEIKEKLIGKTIPIIPDYNAAIDIFIEKIENHAPRKICETNKETIITVFNESNYNNLRSIKYGLWDFARFVDSNLREPKFLDNKQFIQHLLYLFLVYTIESREGEISTINIIREISSEGLIRDKENNLIHNFAAKYRIFKPQNELLSAETWDSILFSSSKISAEDIKNNILNTKYFRDDTSPAWKRLFGFYELEDEEFENLLLETIEQLETGEFEYSQEILLTVGLLIELIDENLCQCTGNKILELGKSSIDELLSKGLLYTKETLPNEHKLTNTDIYWEGYKYKHVDHPTFLEIKTYFNQKIAEAREKFLSQETPTLLKTMRDDPYKFLRTITFNSNGENHYHDKPILKHIQPKDFVATFSKLKNSEKRTIASALSLRYEKHHAKLLLDEVDWLKEVNKLMEDELNKSIGKVSSLSISMMHNYLKNAINILETIKNEE